MEIIIAVLVFGVGIFLSYLIYNSFLNQITLYSVIWLNMIFWYEIRLINYDHISIDTYFIIYSSYILFLFGNIIGKIVIQNKNISSDQNAFEYYLNEKYLKYYILIPGIIGFGAAVLNWIQLFKIYGTLPNIFLHGPEIYSKRVEGEIAEVIPYINSFIIVSIFYSSIYFAKTLKLNGYVILPFISIYIKEMAAFGRSGILFGLFEFVIIFISVRYFLKRKNIIKVVFPTKMVITVLILFIMAIIAATTVKSFRASVENFKGSSRSLSAFKNNIIISPSIYFYMSSHIGVLNKYIEKDNENNEIGANTFLIIHSILSKFDLIERPSDYQKGYMFPNWSNTGTYLREIHGDFGLAGVVVIPFLLGLLGYISWHRFNYNGSFYSFISFVGIGLIVANSFLVMVTRLTYCVIAFGILFLATYLFSNKAK